MKYGRALSPRMISNECAKQTRNPGTIISPNPSKEYDCCMQASGPCVRGNLISKGRDSLDPPPVATSTITLLPF